MIYFVYFHTANPRRTNMRVQEILRSFPGMAMLSPSFFLVRVDGSNNKDNLVNIKSKLMEVASSNDEFIVGVYGKGATWKGYGRELADWLMRNSKPIVTPSIEMSKPLEE